MEPFDLGRRIRDIIIPHIRKKYHITGQYLTLEAAAEVIQVVRLGLRVAGFGELTEEQLSEVGTVLEPEVHHQLRPRSGGKKAVVLEIERLWSERSVAARHPRNFSTQSCLASERDSHSVVCRDAPRHGPGNALFL